MHRRVVFVCEKNACRSQMAEAFARVLTDEKLEVVSAGLRPAERLDSSAVQVMRELGINITEQRPKGLDEVSINDNDVVVAVGLDMDLQALPTVPYRIEWDIPDPSGMPMDTYRRVRDLIEKRVHELLEHIKTEVAIKFSMRQLWLYYGDEPALRDITLDIPANQIFAFIGPSGCGKSSLLRCLNRMNDFIPGARVQGEV
ncbi:MAG TPA: ATP-binding cassette domain-containing protein, partial [Armatimonadetes bacterium]|nr:ATP-binding cassette domain-containing protein [Armatimonadota bacterium]